MIASIPYDTIAAYIGREALEEVGFNGLHEQAI